MLSVSNYWEFLRNHGEYKVTEDWKWANSVLVSKIVIVNASCFSKIKIHESN